MALCLQEGAVGRATWREWLAGSGLAEAEVISEHMLTRGLLAEDGGLLMVGPEAETHYGRRNFLELLSVFTSQARLRALIANVPGAIYRCAPDRDWTMELISDEIERISGYPREDFIESAVRTFASVIHPDDREPVERAVFEACDAGRPFVLEYRIVRADGGETWVLEGGQLVHGGGGIRTIDGPIRPMTVFETAAQGTPARLG